MIAAGPGRVTAVELPQPIANTAKRATRRVMGDSFPTGCDSKPDAGTTLPRPLIRRGVERPKRGPGRPVGRSGAAPVAAIEDIGEPWKVVDKHSYLVGARRRSAAHRTLHEPSGQPSSRRQQLRRRGPQARPLPFG